MSFINFIELTKSFISCVSRDSKRLGYIVAGSLVAIIVMMLCTEIFLSSSGFESRKESFNCLVDYLKSREITDEAFSAAETVESPSTSCSKIIGELNQTFHVDLLSRSECFYSVYNLAYGECDEMNHKFCVVNPNGSINANMTCSNRHDGKFSGHQKSSDSTRANCHDLSDCFGCVIGKLAAKGYEDIRFHATAVNLTVIEFQVWKYFTISPRVLELQKQTANLERSTISDCENENKCRKNLAFCT